MAAATWQGAGPVKPASPEAASPPSPPSPASPPDGRADALRVCRGSFLYAGFFSLFVNLLLLVPALYMLQVYDRVLSSGSESTLLMLTLIAGFLFVVMGGLEWVRSQILVATSARLDDLLAPRVHDAMFRRALGGGSGATAQPLADLVQLRQFLTGPGLFAFFDAPWFPVYVAVMYAFHPLFALSAVVCALVLLALALCSEAFTCGALARANEQQQQLAAQAQRNLRNVEVIQAMGMLDSLRDRWATGQQRMLALQVHASRASGLITTASKIFRIAVQSLVLGLGAWLALRHEISGGAVIAGSILLGRALAPLDLIVNSWRGLLAAREAYRRLDALLAAEPVPLAPMPLPAPRGELLLDKVVVAPPGAKAPVLNGVQLRIAAGTLLAVLGASAAGKTTLLRAMLGLVPTHGGTLRLDGAQISQWDRAQLGPHIGYLPQDVELLEGTIAENIARFGAVDAAAVVQAAEAAGVHGMVLRLAEGYETRVAGHVLSAGQRQRIGLARALYGRPQLVLLDEPNANLDQDGEAALARALVELKRRGATVVIVTHRSNVLDLVDEIVVMGDGQVLTHGPRDKVRAAMQQAAEQRQALAQRGAVVVPARAAGGDSHARQA